MTPPIPDRIAASPLRSTVRRAAALLLGLAIVASLAAKIETLAKPVPHIGPLLQRADTLIVYEGLPHPMFESGAFREERAYKKVFEVGAQYFYVKPLAVSDDDRKALPELFQAIDVFAPFRGEKLCGGFHADYLLEWRQKDERLVQVLVCFSCHEALVIDASGSLRSDLTEKGYTGLRGLLEKYRQERPRYSSKPPKSLKPEPPPPPTVDVKN